MTSTQYPVMSGSTPGISSVKGGVQVRVRVEEHGSGVIRSEPTTDSAPAMYNNNSNKNKISIAETILYTNGYSPVA